MDLSIKNIFLLMGLLGVAQMNAMAPEDIQARKKRVEELHGKFKSNKAVEPSQQAEDSSALAKRERKNNHDEPDRKKAKYENMETEALLLTEQVIYDQSDVGLSADIQNCKALKSSCYKFFHDFSLQKGEIKEEINRRGHNDIVLPLHLYFEECMGSLDSQVHDVAEHRYGENIVLMDGANIVSYSLFGDIKILSHTTGECLCSLKGHGCQINSLINLGNKIFASCSNDRIIRIFDQNTGECLKTLSGHTDSINLLIKLNSGLLASCSSDRTIKIWNIGTGECLHTLKGHSAPIISAVQLMNGFLVSCSTDKQIKVWNLDIGKCIRTLKGHTNTVSSVIELKDGILASCSQDKTIRIWDSNTGECLHVLESHTDSITSVIGLKNGLLVSCSVDKTIRIWDPNTGECLHVLDGHTDSITSVIGLKNGLLVSCSVDKTIRIWDPNAGKCLKIWEGLINGNHPSAIELEDGNLILFQRVKENYYGAKDSLMMIKKINIYPENLSVKQINLVFHLNKLICEQDKIILNKALLRIYNSLPDYLKERYQNAVSKIELNTD